MIVLNCASVSSVPSSPVRISSGSESASVSVVGTVEGGFSGVGGAGSGSGGGSFVGSRAGCKGDVGEFGVVWCSTAGCSGSRLVSVGVDALVFANSLLLSLSQYSVAGII